MSAIPLPPLTYTPAGIAGAVRSPLSPEQFAAIEAAHLRSKKIRRAIQVAAADAWCSSIFAGVTLLSAVFSPWSLLLGLALSATAFNSFRGLRLLKRMSLRAPDLLALNQLALAGIISLYGFYSIWSSSHGSNELSDAIAKEPALQQMLGDLQPLMWKLTLLVYGTVIAGTLAAQGLTAWYYHSRQKYLAAYLRDTPQWIIDVQKQQAGP